MELDLDLQLLVKLELYLLAKELDPRPPTATGSFAGESNGADF